MATNCGSAKNLLAKKCRLVTSAFHHETSSSSPLISLLCHHRSHLSLSILFSSHSASFSPLTQHPFLLLLSILFSSHSAFFSPLTQNPFSSYSSSCSPRDVSLCVTVLLSIDIEFQRGRIRLYMYPDLELWTYM